MVATIVGPDIFVGAFVGLAILATSIWSILDIAAKPEAAFRSARVGKFGWIILIVAFLVICAPVGFATSLYYLVAVRPRVDAAV